ncbi:MAG: hypothetical protein HQP61_07965 [Peptococcaceae bacterium]|nr:hypothetical protein [Candidatus Syntrophopropionicum ammoniitolerans]
MGNNDVEKYINIVLSQLECPELKKTVSQILISEINKLICKGTSRISTQENIADYLLIKLGDPKKLGDYFVWLKNIMDLY